MADQIPSIRIIKFWPEYKTVDVEKEIMVEKIEEEEIEENGEFVMKRIKRKVPEKVITSETKQVDWVEFAPVTAIGTATTVVRVSELMPPEDGMIANDKTGARTRFIKARWAMIQPAYEAWRKGQDIPINGTPLGAWAGLSPEMVNILQQASFQTVEEVAELNESAISRIKLPNARSIVKQAKLFLESADKTVFAKRMEAMEEQNKELSEKLAAATELLEELTKGKKPAEKEPAKGKEAA